MNLEQVFQFFRNPPPAYLRPELALCYVLSVLLEGESYATELRSRLNNEHPRYLLSEPVLSTVMNLLEAENAITCYCQKVPGRGRPRRMFKLNPQWQPKAIELAYFWQNPIFLMGEQAIWRQLKVQKQTQLSGR